MNSKRGGVTLMADGQEYVLRITTNSMVAYQDQYGESFVDGCAAFQENPNDIRRVRNLFWVGLAYMKDFTVDAAGDVMDSVGYIYAMEKLFEAVTLAFPDDNSDEDGEGNVEAVETANPKPQTT